MGEQRLDLVITQLVLEGLHFLFAVFLQAVLDRSEHLVVFQTRLVLRVGLVFDSSHLASLGLAFAVLAVAGDTMFGPVGLDVCRPSWPGKERGNQRCNEEK